MSSPPISASPQPEAEGAPAPRVWCNLHMALGSLVAAIAFAFCDRNISDPDIWWHLRNAQVTLQQHSFIRADSYSWTASGTPWVDSEWLAEVLYYSAYRVGGYRGVYTLYLFLAEFAMLGLLVISTRISGNVKAAFIVSPLAVIMAVVNFGPRTILFGWFCLTIVLYVLWTFRTKGKAPLYLLPVVFLFWVNLHGSWLIGMVICGIFVAGGLVEGTWGNIESTRWSPAQLKQLAVTAGATLAVLFVNPYGYKLVFYPFDLAYRQKLNIGNIEEWTSVNFHDPRGKIVFVLLMLVIVLAMLGKKRWTVTEVLLVIFGFYTSLTYIRFLFLGAMLLSPILARRFDFLPPYRPDQDKPVFNAIFVLLSGFIVFSRYPTPEMIQEDINEKYPLGALQYVHDHPGPVMNHFTWGGYMIMNRPEIPTFIDSRTDIFEYKGVLKDYLDIIDLRQSLDVIDKYHAQYVLFPVKDTLVYLLRNTDRWYVIYEDKVSCLLERSPN